MSFEIAPPAFTTTVRPPANGPDARQRTDRTDAANAYAAKAASVARGEDRVDVGVPASPPPEVLDQVDKASNLVKALADADRELHFAFDDKANRVIVEVRDREGNVVRTIPPSKALDIMTELEFADGMMSNG